MWSISNAHVSCRFPTPVLGAVELNYGNWKKAKLDANIPLRRFQISSSMRLNSEHIKYRTMLCV